VKLNSREISLEQTVSLSAHHNLVIGGSARQDDVQSNVYKPGEVQQTQYALFAEHVWQPVSSWTVVSSGRWDRHSQTGWVFSPRTSLIFSPNAKHVFRLAAGSAFRNPTLTESYVMQEQIIQTSFNVPVTLSVVGNPNLEPERVRQIELAHTGRFGPVRTTLVGFHYRLRNMIGVGQFLFVPEALPTLRAQAEYQNSIEDVEAWGGELGTEIEVVSGWVLFANYSHQHIRGDFEFQVAENGGPVHKFNGGVRLKHGGLSATLWGHWVGQTAWNDASAVNLDAQYTSIGDYFQLNMGVRYTFSEIMKGLSIGFQAFNMTNHTHFETLPARNKLEPGLGGEVMRRRVTGFLAYEF
jgi:outer membrane receptor protein involved in Fe transport